ncbi:MAG: sigma-70 family RNA polymerase sigma factor [Candidatus Omnitrophica bacterium]|nr:sigma-70 family RNA polymerase sigma factor [Candidatus Omnitrophota bacterium]
MFKRTLSDGELVAGCIRGEKASWDLFVERFSKLVYWSIQRTLAGGSWKKRTEVIDEIFQEFFKKLLEKETLRKVRQADNVGSFLVVMACRNTLDMLKSLSRREKRMTTLPSGAEEEEVLPEPLYAVAGRDPTNPAEEAVLRETGTLMEEVLSQLSTKERACLELHYLDGRTHEEAGLILGLPHDTVSTIIRRTREKLKKKCLEKGLD